MDPGIFGAFALAHLALLVWGVPLAHRHGWWTPANLAVLVVAGLVYDNALLALGHLLGEGPLLQGFNLARFWIHALVTPTLVAWALHTLRRAGFDWARRPWFQAVSIGGSLLLVVAEYVLELRDLNIVPNAEHGALSYGNADRAGGPPVMVLVVAAVLILAGALLWRRQGWIWLLVGSVVMTLGSALPLPVASNAVTNAFELVLMTSIMATKAFQDARSPRADRDRQTTPSATAVG